MCFFAEERGARGEGALVMVWFGIFCSTSYTTDGNPCLSIALLHQWVAAVRRDHTGCDREGED